MHFVTVVVAVLMTVVLTVLVMTSALDPRTALRAQAKGTVVPGGVITGLQCLAVLLVTVVST